VSCEWVQQPEAAPYQQVTSLASASLVSGVSLRVWHLRVWHLTSHPASGNSSIT